MKRRCKSTPLALNRAEEFIAFESMVTKSDLFFYRAGGNAWGCIKYDQLQRNYVGACVKCHSANCCMRINFKGSFYHNVTPEPQVNSDMLVESDKLFVVSQNMSCCFKQKLQANAIIMENKIRCIKVSCDFCLFKSPQYQTSQYVATNFILQK